MAELDSADNQFGAHTPAQNMNGGVISSIIDLVCPQCGGRMSEFQCAGRCLATRRNGVDSIAACAAGSSNLQTFTLASLENNLIGTRLLR